MGAGAVLEPLAVIVLLIGGTWVNRSSSSSYRKYREYRKSGDYSRVSSPDRIESGLSSPTSEDGLRYSWSPSRSTPRPHGEGWRERRIGAFGLSYTVTSPDTTVFRDRLLSRVLRKFPFLVECWYWALIYWVCRACPRRLAWLVGSCVSHCRRLM